MTIREPVYASKEFETFTEVMGKLHGSSTGEVLRCYSRGSDRLSLDEFCEISGLPEQDVKIGLYPMVQNNVLIEDSVTIGRESPVQRYRFNKAIITSMKRRTMER